jgi:citronellol/citronellal dehydrogenase
MPYRSVFRPGLFDGQAVIVTGGGSGFGRCIAHELAALGATVMLMGRKQAGLERVAGEIAEDGGRADWLTCNIREGEEVREAVAETVRRLGRIDGLVNNAGGQFTAPLAEITDKGWRAVIDTNLTGGFLMARECYNQWMKGHGGAIVNMTAHFWQGMPLMGHSGAARAGMMNFTQTAALEWAADGVRVNAVSPGPCMSSGLDTYTPDFKQRLRRRAQDIPMKRLGTESEVSAPVLFLLSEASGFITGATIPIDGGLPLVKALWPMPETARSTAYQGFHRSEVPDLFRDMARPDGADS